MKNAMARVVVVLAVVLCLSLTAMAANQSALILNDGIYYQIEESGTIAFAGTGGIGFGKTGPLAHEGATWVVALKGNSDGGSILAAVDGPLSEELNLRFRVGLSYWLGYGRVTPVAGVVYEF